jgi:hypothetical protein
LLETLEQIIPADIAKLVFRFSTHPTADLMSPLLAKHTAKMVRWKAWCERNHRSESSEKQGFALFFFAERKVREARKQGKRAEDIKAANRYVKEIYY